MEEGGESESIVVVNATVLKESHFQVDFFWDWK
jgi:hypothetical protein